MKYKIAFLFIITGLFTGCTQTISQPNEPTIQQVTLKEEDVEVTESADKVDNEKTLNTAPIVEEVDPVEADAYVELLNTTPGLTEAVLAYEQRVMGDTTNYLFIVNKEIALIEGYNPEVRKVNIDFYFEGDSPKKQLREEAAVALESLFAAATEEGIAIKGVSGYRSFNTQQSLYNNYVESNGQEEADRFSAKPGHSEHQTGLAMDISTASLDYALSESFGDTEEGRWVKENAHNYGFIIRYPEGKEPITGYMFEPWHLRFVGIDVASAVYKEQMTLEEFYIFLSTKIQ